MYIYGYGYDDHEMKDYTVFLSSLYIYGYDEHEMKDYRIPLLIGKTIPYSSPHRKNYTVFLIDTRSMSKRKKKEKRLADSFSHNTRGIAETGQMAKRWSTMGAIPGMIQCAQIGNDLFHFTNGQSLANHDRLSTGL